MAVQLLLSLGLACVAAALGLLLWQLATVRARQQAVLRRLRDQAGTLQVRAAPPSGAPAALQARGDPLLGWMTRFDLPARPLALLLLAAPAPLLALAVGLAAGSGLALAAGLLAAGGTAAVLWLRGEQVQRRLVRALPEFVDAMVRTMTLGQSAAAAFLAATAQSEGPLRRLLDHAASLVRAGVDLDVAVAQAGRSQGCVPLTLLGSVLGMATRYGGRVDQVLERLASFLRDREEAQQELMALSSETRMAAWVLSALPAGTTLLIAASNTSYLADMWNDPAGRHLLVGALLLQLVGAAILHRLGRLH